MEIQCKWKLFWSVDKIWQGALNLGNLVLNNVVKWRRLEASVCIFLLYNETQDGNGVVETTNAECNSTTSHSGITEWSIVLLQKNLGEKWQRQPAKEKNINVRRNGSQNCYLPQDISSFSDTIVKRVQLQRIKCGFWKVLCRIRIPPTSYLTLYISDKVNIRCEV